MKPFNLIIVAAGSGERLGANVPKQYLKINNKTILNHTLDAFLSIKKLNNIVLVINPSHAQYYETAVQGYDNIILCNGGATRQQSVHNALMMLSSLKPNDIVLIHDAARPFVTPHDIETLMQAMENHDATTLAIPIADTLRYDNINKSPDRNNLWAIQTPQAFNYKIIMDAHKNASQTSEHTDDTSLVAENGVDIKFVPCGRHNFKITTKQDLTMAKALFEINDETRTGSGFDVHAFDNEKPAQSVRLGGIDIPHNNKLKGHSDADVALHALTDALLGAIGAGDIGLHFPPSDQTFKDMDSAVFLAHAMALLQNKGAKLINIDLTIICEAPKIGPHREKMTARLAELLGIDQARINIKATTTEQLGFTGRREGIAAQAIATLKIPQEK